MMPGIVLIFKASTSSIFHPTDNDVNIAIAHKVGNNMKHNYMTINKMIEQLFDRIEFELKGIILDKIHGWEKYEACIEAI